MDVLPSCRAEPLRSSRLARKGAIYCKQTRTEDGE